MIMVRTEENLRNVFVKLEKSAKNKGLIINDCKTKVMRIGEVNETESGKFGV